ncbi:Transmembrane amino acid transporter protein [Tritrichomonas foetus]|uniref:Transmembrane amino acid transporter protein n=1 Tax=Tritrichomonas foetus TaxID=1144522 RepID=A0A1J4JB43_9EUKA|nr:Transmembrane amino acid transporter protein [Tritrichomonas foetus]|eukprot:OHS96410.1 Transmembrane amino acid transporter protein [Tritrichomonas foetus]
MTRITELSSVSTSLSESIDLNPLIIDKRPRTSCFTTTMNLLNTLVGAEILGIPNSMTFCGLTISVGLMTFAAILSYIATIFIIHLHRDTGFQTVNKITKNIIGKWGGNIYSLLALIFLFCCQVAYLVIGSENITNWLTVFGYPEWSKGWRRSILVLAYSIVLPIALTIPRDHRFIVGASTSAVFIFSFYLAVMIYKGAQTFPTNGIASSVELYKLDITIFNAFAIYTTAFAIPSVILPLLENFPADLHSRYFLIGSSFILCYVVVVIPSTIAYLMFGEGTEVIVLASFDSREVIIQILRVLFFIVLNASYPVVTFVMMTDISAIFFDAHNSVDLEPKKRAFVLFITNVFPVLLAMVLPSVRPILEIGGSFGGCLANFVFPPLLMFLHSKKKWYRISNLLLILFAIFGLVSAGISTYQAVIDAIESITNF